MLDLAHKTAEGLRNTGRAEGEDGRLRLPRMLYGPAREFREYDGTDALAWNLLNRLVVAEYASEPCAAM